MKLYSSFHEAAEEAKKIILGANEEIRIVRAPPGWKLRKEIREKVDSPTQNTSDPTSPRSTPTYSNRNSFWSPSDTAQAKGKRWAIRIKRQLLMVDIGDGRERYKAYTFGRTSGNIAWHGDVRGCHVYHGTEWSYVIIELDDARKLSIAGFSTEDADDLCGYIRWRLARC